MKKISLLWLLLGLLLATTESYARDYLRLQTTSSMEDSGLFNVLIPAFTKDTGIKVKAVSLGTGLALAAAARGEADIVIAHAPNLEKKYQAMGYFSKRTPLFWNDFLIVGPADYKEKFAEYKNIEAVFQKIHDDKILFFSRGDNSGTHNKELEIWQAMNKNPKEFDKNWYKELGQPMGKTLQSAIAVDAITLVDRATFLKSKNRHYVILFKDYELQGPEPDKLLKNNYSIILINKNKVSSVDSDKAQKFFDWMMSADNSFLDKTLYKVVGKKPILGKGQTIAIHYLINGKQVFFPY